MNCDKMNELMSAWLDGELTAGEEQLLREHLENCGECQAVFEQLKGLHTSFSDLEELEPSPDFAQGVMARVTRESKPKVVPFPTGKKNRRAWQVVATLAACAMLAVGLGGTGGMMGGGAAAPDMAPAPEAAMMAPNMTKQSGNAAPAAAEPSQETVHYGVESPAAPAPAPAPGDGAPEEYDGVGREQNAILDRPLPKTQKTEQWTDCRYEFIVEQLPEGLEGAVGLLTWEQRESDGAQYTYLTPEQGEVLQKLLEHSSLSFTQRMIRPHGTRCVLVWLSE